MSDLERMFSAYCSQHKCHPAECWDKHVVRSKVSTKTPEQQREAVEIEHLRLQDALYQCPDCGKYSRERSAHAEVCKGKETNDTERTRGSKQPSSETQHGSSSSP